MIQRPLQSSLPDLGDVTLEMPRLAFPGQRRPYRERTRRPGGRSTETTQDLSASRGPVRRIPQRRPAAISGVFGRLCDAWRQGVRSQPFRCFLGWVGENSVWQQPRIHAPKKRRPQFSRRARRARRHSISVGARRRMHREIVRARPSSTTTCTRTTRSRGEFVELGDGAPPLALHLPCTCPALALHLPLSLAPAPAPPDVHPSSHPEHVPRVRPPHRVPPMRDPAHSPMGGPGRPTLARARGRPTHSAAPSAPRESTFAVIPQALLGVWMTASGSD